MLSLIIAIIFIILFIILCFFGGNYLLRGMLEKMVGNKEHFDNNDINKIAEIDQCKQIDIANQNQLNFQTATNIPLSPNKYKNYIGSIYINKEANKEANFFNSEGIDKGKYCLSKPRLLYDGIWDPQINIDSPYEDETWKLTNGNLSGGYYCSDKLVEVNKPIPRNYIDKTAVYTNEGPSSHYYTYFNDTQDDIFDTQITCFPSVFTAGITEDLKKFL
jgi:hypothetical protein